MGAVAVANPRGADAPRSWRRARRSLAGKITPFAMHERSFTRAAGVSPPWFDTGRTCRTKRIMFAEHRLPHQDGRPSARRGTGIAPATLSVSCRTRMLTCHVGLTSPHSWWFCGADICRRNCDLCDIQTLVYNSGDRQPAVVRETHLSARFRKVAGVCQRCDDELRCSRGSESTGG
jgi:hypothetical protein